MRIYITVLFGFVRRRNGRPVRLFDEWRFGVLTRFDTFRRETMVSFFVFCFLVNCNTKQATTVCKVSNEILLYIGYIILILWFLISIRNRVERMKKTKGNTLGPESPAAASAASDDGGATCETTTRRFFSKRERAISPRVFERTRSWRPHPHAPPESRAAPRAKDPPPSRPSSRFAPRVCR